MQEHKVNEQRRRAALYGSFMSDIPPCRECIWDGEKAAEIYARHDAVIFAAQAGREEAGRSENGLCEESAVTYRLDGYRGWHEHGRERR